MASIVLENVTLSYPILGGAKPKSRERSVMGGAGAVIRDDAHQSRSIVALEGVSLRLTDGDRVGLIGRNGSGKSTLLKIIAGIYEPLLGYARVDGTVAGLFSAGLGIHSETTGRKNIAIYGLMAGHTRKEVERLMPDIAEFCGLGDYLDMPVRTYSNGMAMRLTFACATAFSADIILMDEWLGAGDPVFQKAAQKRLHQMIEDAGILLLASHNHSMIRQNCNKLVWMDRGYLREFGDVDEVLALHEEAIQREAEASKKAAFVAETDPSSVEHLIEIEAARREKRIEEHRAARKRLLQSKADIEQDTGPYTSDKAHNRSGS